MLTFFVEHIRDAIDPIVCVPSSPMLGRRSARLYLPNTLAPIRHLLSYLWDTSSTLRICTALASIPNRLQLHYLFFSVVKWALRRHLLRNCEKSKCYVHQAEAKSYSTILKHSPEVKSNQLKEHLEAGKLPLKIILINTINTTSIIRNPHRLCEIVPFHPLQILQLNTLGCNRHITLSTSLLLESQFCIENKLLLLLST